MKRVTCVLVLLAVAAGLFAAGTTEAATATPEVRTISWYYPGGKQADEESVWDAMNERLAADYDIEVDFQRVDWGAFNDRMNVLIASGEPMDLCFTSNWSNNFYQKVADGAYLPLDDLIKEHAPALLTDLPDFLFQAAEFDGQIYAVPNYQTIVTQWSLLTPQSLADKYDLDVEHIKAGLEIIEQVARLEPYLQALAENEPEIYPFRPFFVFYGLWEQVPGAPVSILMNRDGHALATKAEVDSIKQRYDAVYREWLSEGYIRADIATVRDDRAEQEQLKYGVWTSAYKPGAEIEHEIRYGVPITVIPLAEPFVSARAGDGTMHAVTVNSREPEAAVEFLGIINTDVDLYNMLCFGIEDRHYRRTGPNRVELIQDANGASAYYPNTAWMFGNQFNAWLLPGQDDDIWEVTDRMNRSATVSRLRGFTPDLEPVKSEIAQHNAADQEFWGSEWLYLDDPAEYEAIKKERYGKTMTAGFEMIRAEMQRQIDAWLNETGR